MVNSSSVDENNNQLPMPARCRLLYIVGQLSLGGLERQLYYLLKSLDHALYKPSVVVWNLNHNDKYYKDIEALKIPLYGFSPEWSPLYKLKALRVLMRQIKPEVIHSYGFYTNATAFYAAWGTSTVAIGSLRAEYAAHKRRSGVIRGMLNAKYPAYHISNNTPSADVANRDSSFFAPKHVFVVRNALDLNSFKCAGEAFNKRDYVAAVGSLLPVKRWDRLLKVAKRVKSVAGENIRFQIAGDGPLRPTLEKLADELGISNIVEFRGAVHDMPAFLSHAKFLVHTSAREGCPNAVMEAASCGLPVVAMKTGEIPYLVEEGKTGFVVPQDDETMFVKRVSLLFSDDELCIRMGLAARAKAEREFRLERLVSETLAAYKSAGWRG